MKDPQQGKDIKKSPGGNGRRRLDQNNARGCDEPEEQDDTPPEPANRHLKNVNVGTTIVGKRTYTCQRRMLASPDTM